MLPDFEEATHLLNDRPGVYALYLNRELVYIGQSVNVPVRIAAHKGAKKMRFDKVFVKWCEVCDMGRVEANLISELKPKHNRAGIHLAPVPLRRIDLVALGLPIRTEPRMRRRRV